MTFLNLNPRFVYGDVDLTSAPFAVNQEGIDYQNGDLVTAVLSSFLQDGELEISQRRGNMTLTIPVLIEGSDLLALAEAFALLAREADRNTSTLSIDPGDGIAPITVFDTFRGEANYTYNAAAEQNGFRQYNLTVRALPFGASVDDVVAAAISLGPPPSSTTTATVNDGSSTTGWTGFGGGIVSSNGQTVRLDGGTTLDLVSTFDVSTTRIIVFDWNRYNTPIDAPRSFIASPGGAGVEMTLIATGYVAGFYRTWYQVPAGFGPTVSSVSFFASSTPSPDSIILIDKVMRTNLPPGGSTGRQQLRQVEVKGSARTQGRLKISSASTGLGDVLVYTSPDDNTGYTPALRNYRTSSGLTVVDATTMSGSYTRLDTDLIFQVPVNGMAPGHYALVARLAFAGAGPYAASIYWSHTGLLSNQPVGQEYASYTSVTLAGSGDYEFVPITSFDLPSAGFRSPTIGSERIVLRDFGSTPASVLLDDAYLINLTTGRLTIVKCGSGTPSPSGPARNLWIEAATIATRTPTLVRGYANDGSDAYFNSADVQSLGMHEFSPPRMNTYLACEAPDAQVTFTHRPRWLGHAAL